jgi:tetratricopeptide (TPR) repeat protein
MPPDRTITVKHGSLILNVPCSIFVNGRSQFNDSSDGYFLMLQQRYPWLNDNSLAVLKRRTEDEMRRVIEEGLRGPGKARMLSAEGRDMDAIRHLESYLIDRPEDGDAWYVLGEILCRIGRSEEGYKAINHGRRFNVRTDR